MPQVARTDPVAQMAVALTRNQATQQSTQAETQAGAAFNAGYAAFNAQQQAQQPQYAPQAQQAQQALQAQQAQRPALSTDKEGDNQRTLSTIERLAALEVCLSTTRCVMPLLTYYYSKCISLSDSDSDMHSHLAIVICTVHSTCSDMHSHCFMLLLTYYCSKCDSLQVRLHMPTDVLITPP